MSLEKSTPYRNAWYRDLLEKEAELKQYTDDKVAQAIELPEVTSADNGDLLAAIDGEWDKSDKLKTIMNVGAEQVGKIPIVDAQGAWGVMDIPNELPAVTGADDGKVLGVTSGAWGAVAPSSKGLVIFEIDPRYNVQTLLNNKKISDVVAAIEDGYDVALKKDVNLFRLITTPTNNVNTYNFVCLQKDTSSDSIIVYYLYASANSTGNSFTMSDTYRCVPNTPSTSARKLLGVYNYKFEYIDPELPIVTAADNGNILSVVNGAWAKTTPSGGLIIFEVGGSNNLTLLNDKTRQDVIDAVNTGADVVLKRGGAYFRLFVTPVNQYVHEYLFGTFVTYNNRNSVRVDLLYVDDQNPTSNTVSEYPDYRCIPYTTGRNKLLSIDLQGDFTYIDKELPYVTASDNGNVLSVVNGAWAKSAPNLIKSVQFVNGQALSDADYASIKANTNVRGIYSDASKYIIFNLSSCNFAQTEFEFVNYAEGLKATIDTTKVVTIASI